MDEAALQRGLVASHGGILASREGAPPSITFYVGVDDLEKCLSRAEELGGSRVVGPTSVGEAGSFALFADPDGNTVGLFTGTGGSHSPRAVLLQLEIVICRRELARRDLTSHGGLTRPVLCGTRWAPIGSLAPRVHWFSSAAEPVRVDHCTVGRRCRAR